MSLQNASDSKADGDFLSWWLGQMKAAGASWGKPVVDGWTCTGTRRRSGQRRQWRAATNSPDRRQHDGAARGRGAARGSTRSLWDPTTSRRAGSPTCSETSHHAHPALKSKIAANYPGIKLSFSEWNYGGGSDISGGIAEADALGIFGREGLDMATSWNWPDSAGDNQYEIAALGAFRNYDGKGAHFGDTSVHAVTTDDASSSVYASLDSASGFITIVAINKTTAPLKAGIAITAPAVAGLSARTLTGSGPTLQISSTAPTVAAQNAFTYTMPAMSVSVLTQL